MSWQRALLCLAVTAGCVPAASGQSAPGFTVSTYAALPNPARLTFAPDGVMYVGSEATQLESRRIRRVALGGAVTAYGPPIPDPDAVLFDPAGGISGVAGSVLVGGRVNPQQSQGQIVAVRPDQTVASVFGPTAAFFNPGEMKFDSTGRLVFTDVSNGRVLTTTGGAPAPLFASGTYTFNGLAIGPNDAIYTTGAAADGTIRVHSPTGTPINEAFATGFGISLAFGPGGAFGTDLYAARPGGTIARIAPNGTVTEFGAGFGGVGDLEFGPDGRLYVSSSNDVVYVVTPVPEPAAGLLALTTAAVGGVGWRRLVRRPRGR